MSRRDDAIVAWHEVPGWSLDILEQNSRHDPGELGLLGVERDSPGPKGLKNLGQDLPWVFCLMPKALKGRPLTRRRGTYPEMPVAPSGLLTLGCVSQGKPWAKLSWPVGPKTGAQGLGKCRNSRW